jgi:alcohol dehydrogenase (cytochrome c)
VDAGSGGRLWEFQTGSGVNAPPAIFEHDGTQYVAVYSAGNLFAGSVHGDSVWLFSLDGTLDPVSMPVAGSAVGADGAPADISNADPERGRLVYAQSCASCHGAGGDGGHGGPALTAIALEAASIVATIRDGRVRNGQALMPALGQILTPDEIGDVAAYVLSEAF